MIRRIALIGLTACLIFGTSSQAAVLHGRVDRVIDGDTLVVVTEDDEMKVRIRGIDAPETEQEFGEEARLMLNRLAKGRNVIVLSDGMDGYGRVLASIAVSGTDLGLALIEKGYAWYYETYGSQIPPDWQYAYRTAEANARMNHAGLWQSSGPVPPWSWRKQKRESQAAVEETQRESLEGISQELEENSQLLSEKFDALRKSFMSDSNGGSDSDTELTPKERLSWWELFAKLGEGLSRWLKAFLLSFV